MSEARALTNLVGNTVATVVVAKWENALDSDKLAAELHNPTPLAHGLKVEAPHLTREVSRTLS